MTETNSAWRGDRRVRVAIEISSNEPRILAVTLLEGPAVQRRSLAGALAAHVVVNGTETLIDAFDDPRISRGISRAEIAGHSYVSYSHGTVLVDIPLSSTPLSTVEIRFADLSLVRSRSSDPIAISRYFAVAPRGMRRRGALTLEELRQHPDWKRISSQVGVSQRQLEGFEIYRDEQMRFRWRLRRPDGKIVAVSGHGYASRAACEADLRWIRSDGYRMEIRSLDIEQASDFRR